MLPGRDGVEPVERLAEDQQPQRGLDRAGEQLGAVVADLLDLGEAERRDAAAEPPPAGGAGGGATAASAESASDAPGATDVTELPSFLERVAGVVPEHVLERRRPGPRRASSSVGVPMARMRPRCISDDPVAQLVGLFHVVGREEHGDARSSCSDRSRSQTVSRPTGSSPIVGSSRIEHPGPVDQRLRELEAADHAPGDTSTRGGRRRRRGPSSVQHLGDAVGALATRHVEQAGEHRHVLAARSAARRPRAAGARSRPAGAPASATADIDAEDRRSALAGRSSVVRMRMVVVLPAPLGPRSPNISPVRTEKSTPSTARTSPNA